ncbi:MAG: hypothetical protein ACOVQ5_02405 [Flavobacteriales bacterium]|jgi:hypothetical protein
MKNIALLVITLFISTCAFSQREKEFQVRASYGLAGYATLSETKFTAFGFEVSDSDTSGAATQHFNLDLRYDFTNRITAGIDLKLGSYIYDPEEDNRGKSNSFVVVGISGEFNLMSREKSRLFLGLGLHRSDLELRERDTNAGIVSEAVATYRGRGIKLNLGYSKFFGNSPIGFNVSLGYDSHNFDLEDYIIDNNPFFANYEGTLQVRGLDFSMGLVFRIRP